MSLGACRPHAGQALCHGTARELALELCGAGHTPALLALCSAGTAQQRRCSGERAPAGCVPAQRCVQYTCASVVCVCAELCDWGQLQAVLL